MSLDAILIACAILAEPFLLRLAYRLFPTANDALSKKMAALAEEAFPKLRQMIGLDAEEREPERCGEHFEVFDTGIMESVPHHCALPPGHEGSHRCNCGAEAPQ